MEILRKLEMVPLVVTNAGLVGSNKATLGAWQLPLLASVNDLLLRLLTFLILSLPKCLFFNPLEI